VTAAPETKFIKVEEVNLDPVEIYDGKERESFRCVACGRADFNNGDGVTHVDVPTVELQQAPEDEMAAGLDHKSTDSWKCVKCHITFATEYYKKKHGREVHGRKKNLKCMECAAYFLASRDLKRHRKYGKCMKRVLEDRRTCKFCGKKLGRTDNAKKHMKVCSEQAKGD